MNWPVGKIPPIEPPAEQIGGELRTIDAWATQAHSVDEFLELLEGAGFASARLETDPKTQLADLHVSGTLHHHVIRIQAKDITMAILRKAVGTALRGHELDSGCSGVTPDFEDEFAELLAGAFAGRDLCGQGRTREDLKSLLVRSLALVDQVVGREDVGACRVG